MIPATAYLGNCFNMSIGKGLLRFQKRRQRVRSALKGVKPRLSVHKSNNHVYAQIIDGSSTLASASSLDKEFSLKSGRNKAAAKMVGEMVAKRAVASGIKEVVFDRGGYLYHGRVSCLADAARQNGLKF